MKKKYWLLLPQDMKDQYTECANGCYHKTASNSQCKICASIHCHNCESGFPLRWVGGICGKCVKVAVDEHIEKHEMFFIQS